MDENNMLECSYTSCQEHDKDLGDDDYSEEEERHILKIC
jgi:hypothetical protein